MFNKIEALISGKIRIPSPPAIAIRILDMIRRDDFTFKDLAHVIESDPALVAKVLKMANSSYYRFAKQINGIDAALSVLGSHAVKNIALSFVIMTDLHPSEDDLFQLEKFWRRAITSAAAAELVSDLVGAKTPDLFISALMQDIGVIIFQTSMPNEYHLVMKENLAGQEPIHQIEERHFGYNHHDLGAYLLKSWQLPESIYNPILYQHSNDPIPEEYCTQQNILRLSDYLSSVYHGSQSVNKVREINTILDAAFDIRGECINELIDSVATKSVAILSSFELSPGNMRPFSQIVQEVNEELASLNTSYEYLVLELREAKEKAELLANELQQANKKLMELAFRDGLTGLYNHRYFQEEMDRELERTKRYKRSFSLIIFDIDHFKKINDTYGHPAGDEVLIAIARSAEKAVRASDILARYGGEEFSVILPEANYAEAQVVAERIRSNIEAMSTTVNGTPIKATVSVGYTSYRQASQIKGKEPIISMADRALYTAKQCGRNTVFAMRIPGA